MYMAPGGLNASMRPTHGPAKAKAGLAFASEPINYDRHDIDQQRQLLVDRFAGAGWQCDALLTAAQDADDFYFDSFLQVRMPTWTSGRVVLVGDAGYCASPLSGMGTSLALVGAYVLAGELASAADHRTAFRAYEAEMRAYIATCQEQAESGKVWLVPGSNGMIRFRNWNYRLLRYPPMSKIFDR